ncbi:MAG: DMT family transporter [bacterium]|nr:DMT family transporter [bacterium]
MNKESNTSTKSIAVLIAVLGIVLFSSKAVMVKLAYRYEIDAVSLLLLRMLFALPFYLIVAFIKRPSNPDKIKKTDYWWLIGFGIIGYYLASYFDFLGLQYIKASLERVILFIYPTLVLIISRIFFKTRITRKQVMAILISYAGIVVTFGQELSFAGEESKLILGGILIFLSALTYASYIAGSGWLIPKFGSVTFTSYAMIVSCSFVIMHYLVTNGGSILGYPNEVYYLGFAMAIIATVIPSYLISYAIKGMGASNFAIVGSIGPISTIILANIFLDERMTILQLAGTAIVIAGIVWLTRKKS